MRTERSKERTFYKKVTLEIAFVLFYHVSYFLPKRRKKTNLSFNIIFHLLFIKVKQNNATCLCFKHHMFQHRKNGAQNKLSHEWMSTFRKVALSSSMIVPFDSGVVSFTSTQSGGSHFTSTKPRLNSVWLFSGSNPYTVHYRTVRKQDFFPLWAHGNVTMISHWAPWCLIKHYFKSCEISYMSAYGKGERCTLVHLDRHIHKTSFQCSWGWWKKRGSCQNSLKALKWLDFQLFLHEVKSSLVLAYDTWANL